MDERIGWEIIVGNYLVPIDRPSDGVLERLAAYPRFDDYAQRIGSVLSIMEACRPWLSGPAARRLAEAAYARNDAIDQMVESYGGSVLPGQVRMAAGDDHASDMEAISAFVLACAAHALQALVPLLRGEEGVADDWEWHRVFLDSICPICECGAAPSLTLAADEVDVCHLVAELAEDAAVIAARSADGYRGAHGYRRVNGEMVEGRRQLDGTEARDLAIRAKALELIGAGTKLHNLSSKLREWQQRETGKALSKPRMNDILKRYSLHSSPSKK